MSEISILLLLVSTAGVAIWFFLLIPPDPTHVTTLADNGPGSLRYAINEAPPKSTITFDVSLHGTIRLTSSDLNIVDDLTIRGLGAETLSISSGKSGHVVRVVQGATVIISGLSFKDSKTSNGFIDNGGTLTLNNSTISDNSGGGIYNDYNATLTLNNSIVSYNSGSGISEENGTTLTLNNSTVSDNSGDVGGGIYSGLLGKLTLNNSVVSDNTATYSGPLMGNGGGGGIYSFSPLTLVNSTIKGNTTEGSEGGGIVSTDTLTLVNSTISDNKATGSNAQGGGIYHEYGKATLTNSTVSGNTATNGGGIYTSYNTQIVLLYCTVYDNTTTESGGGIWLDEQSQASIGASIIAGNKAPMAPDIAGQLTTEGYNLVGDPSGAMLLGSPKLQSTDMLGVPLANLGIDPILRDNGGSTKPHTWTHALLPGSPAIDLLPLDSCLSFKVFNDQRGVKRPQQNGCDSGAYEHVST